MLGASRRLMRAELRLAFTPYQRRAAVQGHVEQVQRNFEDEQERVRNGEGTGDDEAEALRVLTDARALLADQPDGLDAPPPEAGPATAEVARRLGEVERKLDRALDLLDRIPDRPTPR